MAKDDEMKMIFQKLRVVKGQISNFITELEEEKKAIETGLPVLRKSEKIVLNHLGLIHCDKRQEICPGEIDLTASYLLILEVFYAYLAETKKYFELAPANEKDIYLKRLFPTFEEYQELFRYRFISETDYSIVRKQRQAKKLYFDGYNVDEINTEPIPIAMKLLDIPENQNSLDNFIKSNKNTMEGYIKLILNSRLSFINFFKAPFQIWLPAKEIERHTFITGQTGSGKSELLKILIHQHIKRQSNKCIILIDPHGDLARQVAFFARDKSFNNNFNVIYIDPEAITANFTACINFFDIVDHDNDNLINKLSQEFTASLGNTIGDSTLSLQMETILTPCIATLLKRPGSTLRDLTRFMKDDKNKDLVEFGKMTSNVIQRDFFTDSFYNSCYRQTKDSLNTRITSILSSTVFLNMTCGKTTINLADEINKNNIIIFNLSKKELGNAGSQIFGRFIVSTILIYILQRKKDKNGKCSGNPVHLFIDEFQNFVNESVDLILCEARKFGLHLTLACQMLSQISAAEIKDSVLSNTAIKIIGQNGTKTLRALAAETSIEVEDLKKLSPGEFFIKAGNRNAYKCKIPSYLYNYTQSNYTEPTFKDFKQYYRKIEKEEQIINDEISVNKSATNNNKIENSNTTTINGIEIPENDFKPKFEL